MPKSQVPGNFPSYKDRDSILAPGTKAVVPTTDNVPFPDGPCTGLYIGTTGLVVGKGPDDTAPVTFRNPTAGQFLYYSFVALDPATTASNLLACY